MIHTTLNLAKAAGAWCRKYDYACIYFEDVRKFTRDTPISLLDIYHNLSLTDALWCLRCVLPAETMVAYEVGMAFACDCAESVLPLLEVYEPSQLGPRRFVERVRSCVASGGTSGDVRGIPFDIEGWYSACNSELRNSIRYSIYTVEYMSVSNVIGSAQSAREALISGAGELARECGDCPDMTAYKMWSDMAMKDQEVMFLKRLIESRSPVMSIPTPEEAERELDAARPDPLTKHMIDEMVRSASRKNL